MAYLYEDLSFYPKSKSIESKKLEKYLSDNNIHHQLYGYTNSLPTGVANTKPAISFVKCEYATEVAGASGTRATDANAATVMIVNKVSDLPADFSTKAESKANQDAKQ